MYNPFSLQGKTILITGASSGIGRTTAIECSKLGANVCITGRDADRLDETFSALHGDANSHIKIVADLTNENELQQLVDSLPILDGCVNNAGIGKMLPLQFYSTEVLENIFGINTFAPMLLMKYLVKKKKLKNPSSVVFTASISGYT